MLLHARPFVGVFQKSISVRFINFWRYFPTKTRKWLQERGRDTPTKGLVWTHMPTSRGVGSATHTPTSGGVGSATHTAHTEGGGRRGRSPPTLALSTGGGQDQPSHLRSVKSRGQRVGGGRGFWGYNPACKVTPVILHGVESPELAGEIREDDTPCPPPEAGQGRVRLYFGLNDFEQM